MLSEVVDAAIQLRLKFRNIRSVIVVSPYGIGAAFAVQNQHGTEQPYVVAVPPVSVEIEDMVGAADSFCGAFTAKLLQEFREDEAIVWAIACGARSTTIAGAQTSMPSEEELETFMKFKSIPMFEERRKMRSQGSADAQRTEDSFIKQFSLRVMRVSYTRKKEFLFLLLLLLLLLLVA